MKLTWEELIELYEEKAPGCKIDVFDRMMEIS
jgi:hypothetical protein